MKRNLAVLIIVAALVGFAIYQNVTDEAARALPSEQAAKKDFLAPHFELQGLDGQTYAVNGEREKVLFINFWASWCGPCELEAPELVHLHEKYQDELDIYAVNATQDDNVDNAKAFAEEYGFEFPVLLDDQEGKKGEVTDLYNVYGYPMSFLVNRSGVIVDIIPGILPPDDLESRVKKLIKNG
ncbi:TlpA family protein disulfide reductase [Marinicrinis sediminis]|uniref:TlpA family protein disulfide reductase n=1 Tax=Marinicrinis sediminis TaxID=1652465 RepID=A0ABW5RB59_9BACL